MKNIVKQEILRNELTQLKDFLFIVNPENKKAINKRIVEIEDILQRG